MTKHPARGNQRPRIGLQQGTVKLAPPTPQWAAMYEKERRRIRRRFPSKTADIQHIGSTAIPGVIAKPIIDIAIQAPSFHLLKAYIRRLESLGYAYKGEYGLPGRHFFVLGDPVTHHVHLVESGSDHWKKWLLFRDYLRSNPDQAQRYNTFKQELARRFPDDRNAYTRAKTPFVNSLLRRARLAARLSHH